MTKQANKNHVVESAPSFYGQPMQYEQPMQYGQSMQSNQQPQYTTQLSRPSTKATYSCNACRRRGLKCDSHNQRPCTNCIKRNTTHSCTSLPRNSVELFLHDDPRAGEQTSVPFHQYRAEQGWNLRDIKRPSWDTQAQLAPYGSEALNGRAAGTAEEPMSVTSNMP